MSEDSENKNFKTVHVRPELKARLLDEQDRLRRMRPKEKKPSLSQIIERALELYDAYEGRIQSEQYTGKENAVVPRASRNEVDNQITDSIKSSRGPDQQRWFVILEEVLSSGNFTAIDAICSNLIAFQRLVQADSTPEGRGGEHGKTASDSDAADRFDEASDNAEEANRKAGEALRTIQAELSRIRASLKRRQKSA